MSGDALIAIKGGVVGEYNGKTLGTWRTTKVDFNPDIPEATHLRTWLAANPDGLTSAASLTSGGGGGPSSNASSRKSIAAIGEEGLGHGEKPDYVTVKASVAYIKPSKKSWYPACPRMRDGRQCNKRVDEVCALCLLCLLLRLSEGRHDPSLRVVILFLRPLCFFVVAPGWTGSVAL